MSDSSIRGESCNGNGLNYEPRATSLVKSTGKFECAGMFEPVLTRLRTHMRAKLGDQTFTKRWESAFAEHLPYLGIWKTLECRDL